jgi:RecJ-like exonuclease
MKIRCEACGGHGVVTIAHTSGPVGSGYFEAIECDECDGEAEIDVLCDFCEQPVDDLGYCVSCHEPLTECVGDPLRKVA